jgi:ribosomal protein S18 acetylase RimI-like enzyme
MAHAIRELTSAADLEKGYAILRELRTELSLEMFIEIYRAARAENGYRFELLEHDGKPVAVMGSRLLHDIVHGRHLYIDDLVVTASERSKGWGSTLLAHAEVQARERGCRGLRLCTGVENEGAIRFYEREGWKARAFAFKKSIT